MPDPDPNVEQDVFELDRIRQLVELMKKHDLSEIDLRQAHQRIRLSCAGSVEPVVYSAPQAAVPAPAPAPAPPAPQAEGVAQVAEDEAHIVTITCPMVGTFYIKPNPNAEPYVRVGDHVSADKVICIVEAMKVFNEIPAEINGRIVAVLLDDGEPVDFGRPLFKVDTSN